MKKTITLLMLAVVVLNSCKSVEYVPVTQHHTEHHWHRDSVITADSVIIERETVVTQLDSAQMAKYGIQLKSAERAWLVRTAELERQIQQLMQLSQTSDTVHDSIPVPYPVVKETQAELSWWQNFRITLANIILIVIGLGIAWGIFRIVKKQLL